MNIAHALIHARALSKKNQPFEVSFIKADGNGRDALRGIEKCILRKADPNDENRDFKLFLFDVETKENRSCWIPLLSSIDHHKITAQ